jgi:predicted kinase
MSKIIFAMAGHTAAGKTTLAKYLHNEFGFEYISEGNIKRQLVENYSAKDSLNEALRDEGYEKAIKYAMEVLEKRDYLILDASFHKQFRRLMLDTALRSKFSNYILVWLYCNCSNCDEVDKRIRHRKFSLKNADNQADDISIYNHIMTNFDLLEATQMGGLSIVIFIDTYVNKILNVECSYNSLTNVNELIDDVLRKIDEYLNIQRGING